MAKLNQIIAVSSGQKGRTQKVLTEVYHKIQKEGLLSGLSRKYSPKDEDGERFPSESKKVNYRAADVLTDAQRAWTELFDVVATQDAANCEAVADVIVDGTS